MYQPHEGLEKSLRLTNFWACCAAMTLPQMTVMWPRDQITDLHLDDTYGHRAQHSSILSFLPAFWRAQTPKWFLNMIVRRGLSAAKYLTRVLSTRATAILSSVGIPTTGEISGVYDGQWKGSGDLFSSICPTTGETLATVRTASPEELHEALDRTREAYIQFRSNSFSHILHFTVTSHSAVDRCACTPSWWTP